LGYFDLNEIGMPCIQLYAGVYSFETVSSAGLKLGKSALRKIEIE
jgi:hypothetical protein